MSRRWKYALLGLVLLLLCAVPLAMQFDNGAITGRITDQHGPVVNASVEARNASSGASGAAQTDGTGRYLIDGLRQGRYGLWVRAPGHETVWVAQVVVLNGQTSTRDVFVRSLEGDISYLTGVP
jgi:hypothetical protein